MFRWTGGAPIWGEPSCSPLCAVDGESPTGSGSAALPLLEGPTSSLFWSAGGGAFEASPDCAAADDTKAAAASSAQATAPARKDPFIVSSPKSAQRRAKRRQGRRTSGRRRICRPRDRHVGPVIGLVVGVAGVDIVVDGAGPHHL